MTAGRVRLEQPFTDLSKLDLVRYAATAQQLARKFETDAELTQILAMVKRDGTVASGLHYIFWSAQGHRASDTGRLDCSTVDVQPREQPIVLVRWSDRTACGTPTRLPKCPPAKITSRLRGGNTAWTLKYRDTTWFIGGEEIADDC